jgi:hypothetical protein
MASAISGIFPGSTDKCSVRRPRKRSNAVSCRGQWGDVHPDFSPPLMSDFRFLRRPHSLTQFSSLRIEPDKEVRSPSGNPWPPTSACRGRSVSRDPRSAEGPVVSRGRATTVLRSCASLLVGSYRESYLDGSSSNLLMKAEAPYSSAPAADNDRSSLIPVGSADLRPDRSRRSGASTD